jgi:hypothetical protein
MCLTTNNRPAFAPRPSPCFAADRSPSSKRQYHIPALKQRQNLKEIEIESKILPNKTFN